MLIITNVCGKRYSAPVEDAVAPLQIFDLENISEIMS